MTVRQPFPATLYWPIRRPIFLLQRQGQDGPDGDGLPGRRQLFGGIDEIHDLRLALADHMLEELAFFGLAVERGRGGGDLIALAQGTTHA